MFRVRSISNASPVRVTGSHGLRYLDWTNPDNIPSWSSEFDLWDAQALAAGDIDELAKSRTSAPGMPYAHPTVEHFTPLRHPRRCRRPHGLAHHTIDGYVMGLARRSFQVH